MVKDGIVYSSFLLCLRSQLSLEEGGAEHIRYMEYFSRSERLNSPKQDTTRAETVAMPLLRRWLEAFRVSDAEIAPFEGIF